VYLGFTRMIDQIIADNKSNKDCRNQNIIDTTNMCLHLQRKLIDLIGYLLGFVLFVGLMWLASGRPAFWLEVATKEVVAWGLMLCGLLLNILFIQVLSEERRLHRDFGNEYDVYCRHTRRF